MTEQLSPYRESKFPNLRSSGYVKTSDESVDYNCVAWAADVTDRVWDPDPLAIYFWPAEAPRQYTVEAFVAAFEAVGYVECDSGELEPGREKIAIFATDDMAPRHAARQLSDGNWTSKLGDWEDIEHPSLEDVASEDYGAAVRFMSRPYQHPNN